MCVLIFSLNAGSHPSFFFFFFFDRLSCKGERLLDEHVKTGTFSLVCVFAGGEGFRMQIDNVQADDEGVYKCEASAGVDYPVSALINLYVGCMYLCAIVGVGFFISGLGFSFFLPSVLWGRKGNTGCS